jgi:hypothetical protein
MIDKDKSQVLQIQKAVAGRDSKIIGGDNSEKNGNWFVGIFFFAILALGGLAWAFTIGQNQGGQTPRAEHKQINQDKP